VYISTEIVLTSALQQLHNGNFRPHLTLGQTCIYAHGIKSRVTQKMTKIKRGIVLSNPMHGERGTTSSGTAAQCLNRIHGPPTPCTKRSFTPRKPFSPASFSCSRLCSPQYQQLYYPHPHNPPVRSTLQTRSTQSPSNGENMQQYNANARGRFDTARWGTHAVCTVDRRFALRVRLQPTQGCRATM
jgi:hypothetical protein